VDIRLSGKHDIKREVELPGFQGESAVLNALALYIKVCEFTQ
jgi:hypothetical protein